MKFQSITGTKDILPDEAYQWEFLESTFRYLARLYNYREIRTPIFEHTNLFARSIGEYTDIVGKEMYTFEDRGGNSLTLKPEMTAAVVRAYIQHNLGQQQPVSKLYYISPMFRQERPQKGRLRQFHQFGLEILGTPNADADTEIITLNAEYYRILGIDNTDLRINSVGCQKCRPLYREKLKEYLFPHLSKLSPDSKNRFEVNPFRILDSKDERDIKITKNAPLQLDHLCNECDEHFSQLQKSLKAIGIKFTTDGRIVRGLDYYTRTAFEFVSSDLGSQDALSGGGRYDLLVEQLGGKPTPCVGVAGGLERVMLVLTTNKLHIGEEPTSFTYLAAADDHSREWVITTSIELRRRGIACEFDFLKRSLKAQMREASRQKVKQVVIAGSEERSQNKVIVKDMEKGEQKEIPIPQLIDYIHKLAIESLHDITNRNRIPTKGSTAY